MFQFVGNDSIIEEIEKRCGMGKKGKYSVKTILAKSQYFANIDDSATFRFYIRSVMVISPI